MLTFDKRSAWCIINYMVLKKQLGLILLHNAMMMQLSIVATILFMHDGLGGPYDGKAPLVMGLWATCKSLLCNTFYQSLEFPP